MDLKPYKTNPKYKSYYSFNELFLYQLKKRILRPKLKYLIMPIYTNLSFWVYFCCSILSNILIDMTLYLCSLTDQQSSKRKHISNIFDHNTE